MSARWRKAEIGLMLPSTITLLADIRVPKLLLFVVDNAIFAYTGVRWIEPQDVRVSQTFLFSVNSVDLANVKLGVALQPVNVCA